jgi:hypothetical protein
MSVVPAGPATTSSIGAPPNLPQPGTSSNVLRHNISIGSYRTLTVAHQAQSPKGAKVVVPKFTNNFVTD